MAKVNDMNSSELNATESLKEETRRGRNKLMKKILAFFIALIPFAVNSQIITTFCGNGVGLHSGDNGSNFLGGITYSCGGAYDRSGNYYFTEITNGHTVRKISPSGIITTVAGVVGMQGYNGDNIMATSAMLNTPVFVAIDTLENIFISDQYNHRIRKVDKMTGIISTVVGTGVVGNSGDNTQAIFATIGYPTGLCIDKLGNIFFADNTNNRIRKVNSNGIISNYAGTGLSGYNSDGILAVNSQINAPAGLSIDDTDNLYIVDVGNSRIRKVNYLTGIISTIAGNGTQGFNGENGLAINAQISPNAIAIDRNHNLYISSGNMGGNIGNRIRRISNLGIINGN